MKEDAEESFYKACDLVLREFEKINGKFAFIGLVKISFPVQETFCCRAEMRGLFDIKKGRKSFCDFLLSFVGRRSALRDFAADCD